MIPTREKGLAPHEAPAPTIRAVIGGQHAGQRNMNFNQRLMS